MKVAGAAGELGGLRRGFFIPSYKGKNTLERFLLRGVSGKVRGQGFQDTNITDASRRSGVLLCLLLRVERLERPGRLHLKASHQCSTST
jgi:hypothetical protein